MGTRGGGREPYGLGLTRTESRKIDYQLSLGTPYGITASCFIHLVNVLRVKMKDKEFLRTSAAGGSDMAE